MATLTDLIELRMKQDNSTNGYVRLVNDYRNEKWNITFIDNFLKLDKGIRNEDFPPESHSHSSILYSAFKNLLRLFTAGILSDIFTI